MGSDENERSQLDAIVGSAIRALVESGADDAFVGSFAVTHRAKVAQLLGHSNTPPAEPSLEEIVSRVVVDTLEAAGLTKKRESKAKTKRVNVTIAGQRTSLTLNRQLVTGLIEAKGAKAANALFEELANAAPQPPGRSKWVAERVQSMLSFDGRDAAATSSQRH